MKLLGFSFHCLIFIFLFLPVQGRSIGIEVFNQNVQISGQSQIYTELYKSTGANPGRPPSTARITANPHLRFSDLFTVSAQLMLSTEGSSARQNINILGLHPTWSWGKAHVGDYSDYFSRYTFNGINVKGAEIDLFPGNFRFTLGGGQTRRAVEGTLVHESYDQYMASSRIGYQTKNNSFFHLIFLKAKDDPASLKKPKDWDYDYVIPDTLETELDTLWIEPPYNPLSVTPQENLVIGFASRLNLLNNHISLEIEGNGSAYTKDINASAVKMDSLDIDSFTESLFTELFTPRAGSNFDYALNTHVEVTLDKINMNAGYRRIGPGYISLGTPSMVNDRRELLLNTRFRTGIHRIRLGWNQLSDNLLDQKLQTNIRNQLQGSVSTITKHWHSRINLRSLIMNNQASSDSIEWNFNNYIISTHQSFVPGRESTLRNIGLQYTFQTSEKTLFAESTTSRYHTASLTTNIRIAQQLSLNTSIGLSLRDSNHRGQYTTQVYSARLVHTAFRNKLSTVFFTSSSMVRDTRMLRTGLTSNYRLGASYRLTLNLSFNDFSGTRKYREFRPTLMLSRQF
ncbi:MAG: hypothetical protein U5R06_15660 [candidate division KSB1 bacterium]|nr:hypothetical protein [candidate division KSB1 bacterium]